MTVEEKAVIRAALAWRGQWKRNRLFDLQKYNEAQMTLLNATLNLKRARRREAMRKRLKELDGA